MSGPLHRRLVVPAAALIVGALGLTGCTSATLQTAPSARAPAVTASAASALPSSSAAPPAIRSASASPKARVDSLAHATISGDYTGRMTLPRDRTSDEIVPGELLFLGDQARIAVTIAPGTNPTGEVPTSKDLTLSFGVPLVGTDYRSADGSCILKFDRDDAVAIGATFTCSHLKSAGSPKVLDISGDFVTTP